MVNRLRRLHTFSIASRRLCRWIGGGTCIFFRASSVPAPAGATVYNDGGSHTISGPDTDVVVTNATTVNVVPGAAIVGGPSEPFGSTAVSVFDAILNVTGGSMTGSSAHNGGLGLLGSGGQFDITGGTFQGGDGSSLGAGAGARFDDWSTLSISGGNFYGGQGDGLFGSPGGDGLSIHAATPLSATISGGTFRGNPTSNSDGYDLRVTGMATVDISGGNFLYGHSTLADQAVGNLSGGDFNWMQAYNQAAFHMTDGYVQTLGLYDSAVADVSGGDVFSIEMHNDAVANVSGGQLSGTSVLNDDSIVNLTGGTLLGAPEDFVMFQNSVLNVFGMGLSLEFVEEVPGFPYWLLHGTLQNGTPIAEPTIILRRDSSVVNLYEIPEPSGFLLAVCGCLGLAGACARRWPKAR